MASVAGLKLAVLAAKRCCESERATPLPLLVLVLVVVLVVLPPLLLPLVVLVLLLLLARPYPSAAKHSR